MQGEGSARTGRAYQRVHQSRFLARERQGWGERSVARIEGHTFSQRAVFTQLVWGGTKLRGRKRSSQRATLPVIFCEYRDC